MTLNRAQRRAIKGNAGAVAAVLASRCYGVEGGAIALIQEPKAKAALTRAFAHLLRAGGQSLALPLTEAEARSFPRYGKDLPPGAVSWLAVGMDADNRASFALQSAIAETRAQAHEAARALALARLAEVCATPGFPGWRRKAPDDVPSDRSCAGETVSRPCHQSRA